MPLPFTRLAVRLFSLTTFCLTAQNLVPNSGFEMYDRCPNGFNTFGQAIRIPHWFSPTTGTPDYFNECSLGDSKARINWAGRCDSFSGRGYVGIITYMDKNAYREYLSVELLEPLDSGVTYSIQFSFRLSSYSRVSSGNIGLVFTGTRLQVRHDKLLSLKPALLAMPDSAIVLKTGDWQVATGEYVANGGERFLVLGNFSAQSPIYRIKYGGVHQPMLQNASFYYFDDVIVQRPVEFFPDMPVALDEGNPFESDSTIVLKNVQFAYNSSVLNEISEAELIRLFNFIQKNPDARIAVHGHTDDQGTEEYNRDLSLRRAKAVTEYLIGKGIEKDRMTYSGFGKSKPLIPSTDEHARSINRRVEVKLLE